MTDPIPPRIFAAADALAQCIRDDAGDCFFTAREMAAVVYEEAVARAVAECRASLEDTRSQLVRTLTAVVEPPKPSPTPDRSAAAAARLRDARTALIDVCRHGVGPSAAAIAGSACVAELIEAAREVLALPPAPSCESASVSAEELCDRVLAHVDHGHADAMAIQVVLRDALRANTSGAEAALRELRDWCVRGAPAIWRKDMAEEIDRRLVALGGAGQPPARGSET